MRLSVGAHVVDGRSPQFARVEVVHPEPKIPEQNWWKKKKHLLTLFFSAAAKPEKKIFNLYITEHNSSV